MATENIALTRITAQTSYSDKTLISVLNRSADDNAISITINSSAIQLGVGQSVTLSASFGFFLPTVTVDLVGGTMVAEIITQ